VDILLQLKSTIQAPRVQGVAIEFWVATHYLRTPAIRKDKSVRTAAFQAIRCKSESGWESLSSWMWESDCYANNCCWGPADLQIT